MRTTDERSELEAQIAQLQRALAFWLPYVPLSDSPFAARAASDAKLLFGYLGAMEKSAVDLGWMVSQHTRDDVAKVQGERIRILEDLLEQAGKCGMMVPEIRRESRNGR